MPPKRFLLRLDPRLFDALRQWAEDDLRSVNAQIEYLLADRARRAGRLRAKRGGGGASDTSSGDDGDDAGPRESDGRAGPVARPAC
jgi:hypothetical protein